MAAQSLSHRAVLAFFPPDQARSHSTSSPSSSYGSQNYDVRRHFEIARRLAQTVEYLNGLLILLPADLN